MGKQGPCYHCGVTTLGMSTTFADTPLWRNGPPEKPVLCNACGSRWRTKGTLVNYTPLHARAEGDDYEDPRVSKSKALSLKNRDENMKKRKPSYDSNSLGRYASNYNQGFHKSIDEDTSNRSSSGSAISNSESCAQFSADASDFTGPPAQSVVWEAQVPSKKRTTVSRPKPSSVEKLTQDLCAILHEQPSSYLSGTSEEELLFESDTPMVSVEIGHGSVLIKHPSSLPREEDSEASSLSVENKPSVLNETHSFSAPLSGCKDLKGDSVYHGNENVKNPSSQMLRQEPAKRDKSTHEKMQLLWNHNSPLCRIDLDDIISFDVLLGQLTSEEQQQLLKYLPSSDTSQLPGSLRSMFDSTFFKENVSSFQQLLSEGVFSDKADESKTLKKLVVSNLTKSKWLELYKKLKDKKFDDNTGEHLVALGVKSSQSKNLGSAKRSHEELSQKTAETKAKFKSPKRILLRVGPATKEPSERNGSTFTPRRSLFALPTETKHLMLEPPHQFSDENLDQDLLLDVPSNGFFPEAELLPVSSFASHQMSQHVTLLGAISYAPEEYNLGKHGFSAEASMGVKES
ncbi:hypothetical protein V2J09_001730 [Rumex salicifolius]